MTTAASNQPSAIPKIQSQMYRGPRAPPERLRRKGPSAGAAAEACATARSGKKALSAVAAARASRGDGPGSRSGSARTGFRRTDAARPLFTGFSGAVLPFERAGSRGLGRARGRRGHLSPVAFLVAPVDAPFRVAVDVVAGPDRPGARGDRARRRIDVADLGALARREGTRARVVRSTVDPGRTALGRSACRSRARRHPHRRAPAPVDASASGGPTAPPPRHDARRPGVAGPAPPPPSATPAARAPTPRGA